MEKNQWSVPRTLFFTTVSMCIIHISIQLLMYSKCRIGGVLISELHVPYEYLRALPYIPYYTYVPYSISRLDSIPRALNLFRLERCITLRISPAGLVSPRIQNGSLSLRRLTQHGRNPPRPPQQRTPHDQPPRPRAHPTAGARAHPVSDHLGSVVGEQRLGARASWIQGHWQGLSRLAAAAN